jgi:hypothetical protein
MGEAVAVGAIAFIALTAWVSGRDSALRAATVVLAALAMALLLTLPGSGETIAGRAASAAPELDGGLSSRVTIWRNAINAWGTTPWAADDDEGELPGLSAAWARSLVGYGPDMFTYAYLAVGDPTITAKVVDHAHNFLLHTLVELGVLGAAAYAAMLAVAGAAVVSLTRRARRGELSPAIGMIAGGLGAALAARLVEQATGKAQISDLMLSWMLAGALVGLTVMTRSTASGGAPGSTPAWVRAARWGVAGVLVVMVAPLWWQTTAVNMSASFAAADAALTIRDGDRAQGLRDLAEASGQASPAAPLYDVRLATPHENDALAEPDAEKRVELLLVAREDALRALRWNPLDVRAYERLTTITLDLALARPEYADEAVEAARAWASLMPGYWQPRFDLGAALVRLGMPEPAIEPLRRVIGLTASRVVHVSALRLLADAYEQMGLAAEAAAATAEADRLASGG